MSNNDVDDVDFDVETGLDEMVRSENRDNDFKQNVDDKDGENDDIFEGHSNDFCGDDDSCG